MEKKKLKQKKNINEDMRMIRNMLLLLLLVAVIIISIYFLTEKLLNKDEVNDEVKTSEVNINYDIATIGTMFNRSENIYYVLLYSTKNDSRDYSNLLTSYRTSDNYIKTYFIDLDLKFNSPVLGDKLNKKPNNSNEVMVKGPTLYKIENGKVVNCYSKLESIIDVLK